MIGVGMACPLEPFIGSRVSTGTPRKSRIKAHRVCCPSGATCRASTLDVPSRRVGENRKARVRGHAHLRDFLFPLWAHRSRGRTRRARCGRWHFELAARGGRTFPPHYLATPSPAV